MKNFFRLLSITICVLSLFLITVTVYANSEAMSNDESASTIYNYSITSDIPMFSFEEPFLARIRITDKTTNEPINNVNVIFESAPGSSPPYNHTLEFAFYDEIMSGNTDDTAVQEYINYLKTFKPNKIRSSHKVATFNSQTGYYETTFTLDRGPYQIKAYIIDPNGVVHNSDVVYPHRAHCESFDVLNIELAKQYLHYMSQYATNGDWQSVNKTLGSLTESLMGNHGLYYMLENHHGQDISDFKLNMEKLEDYVSGKAKNDVVRITNELLSILQKGEDYFGIIEVTSTDETNATTVKVWDYTYNKGVENAIVVIQNNYSVSEEMKNPSIVAYQKPNEGKYHATLSHLPEGIYAKEIGDGEYLFEGVVIDSNTAPLRIFVYHALGRTEIPGKIITKEINFIE